MKYVYGPVKSRRLGLSLGVTTVPYKVCSFDCVYCQLGPTRQKVTKRASFIDDNEILGEIRAFFENKPKELVIDYVTFSGSGEPTLSFSLGSLIKGVREITNTRVALITNSSLLVDPKVRKEAAQVDLIVPSLDAVTQAEFEKIDRPVKGMKVNDIIRALKLFRNNFQGEMWLEVMLVRDINDMPAYLRKIKKVIDTIKPDKVQLNTPVRLPAQKWVKVPAKDSLKKAREIFGVLCDVVC